MIFTTNNLYPCCVVSQDIKSITLVNKLRSSTTSVSVDVFALLKHALSVIVADIFGDKQELSYNCAGAHNYVILISP